MIERKQFPDLGLHWIQYGSFTWKRIVPSGTYTVQWNGMPASYSLRFNDNELGIFKTPKDAMRNAELQLDSHPHSKPFWAIVYHTNSSSPRAKKWYHVARVIEADGKLFELYWHENVNLRHDNKKLIRARMKELGIDLSPGIYCDAPSPRIGSVIVRADQRRGT
jgi:hypothetical protein